jgi:L-lactate dehydrogenase
MDENSKVVNKVGIVGCGHVGMAAASSLFYSGLASDLVLVDHNKNLAAGEAMDLMHGQGYATRCHVSSGDYSNLVGARYIVISAGVSQKVGETRINLLNRNIEVFKQIIPKLDKYCPDAIIIIATNPVDIMTYASQEISSRPWQKIIGTGTMLDTSRFRALIGEFYGIDPRSVHAMVLGEHGDSEVPLWSSATIAGQSILSQEFLGKKLSEEDKNKIEFSVKNAAYQIIEKKGHTNWAIGFVISHLVKIIENDQKTILPISVRFEGELGLSGLCLGYPCVVGVDGIEKKMDMRLDESEKESLYKSGTLLRSCIQQLDL